MGNPDSYRDWFFAGELQVFFEVIGQGRHQYVLIGLCHSSGVDAFHVVVVDERSQDRFYGGASSFGEKSGVVLVPVQLFLHPVIQRFVKAVFYLFELGYFSTTSGSKGTIPAILFTASITLLLIAFAVG